TLVSLGALKRHITQRVHAERERDRLFNLSLDMLAIIGLDGAFKRVNPAFDRILGFSGPAVVGRFVLDFVHPDDRAATRAEMERLSQGVPTIQFENRCRAASGEYRWLVWAVNPVVE